jgi:hypothetical protein
MISIRNSFSAFKEAKCRFCYSGLLLITYILLRRGLYIPSAGLYLYKMYSIFVQRDDVYLQVAVSPVPGQYSMTESLKVSASQVFPKSS